MSFIWYRLNIKYTLGGLDFLKPMQSYNMIRPPLTQTSWSIVSIMPFPILFPFMLSSKLTIEHVRTCTKAHILWYGKRCQSVKRIDFKYSFGSSIVVKRKQHHTVTQHIFILCLILNSLWKSIRTFYNDVINGDTSPAIYFCVFDGMIFVSLVKCIWFVVDFLLFFPIRIAVVAALKWPFLSSFHRTTSHKELLVNIMQHRTSLSPLSECYAIITIVYFN